MIIISIVALLFAFANAYADGLASETLPPQTVQNNSVTLSIGTLPFEIDSNHSGTQLNVILMNARTTQPIPHATLAVTALKGQDTAFSHTFQSDSGNFILRFYPQSSANTTYDEVGSSKDSSSQNSGYYEIKGPVFNSSGLYRFEINVLTMNSYSNKVNTPFSAGISIPEDDNLTVNDPTYGTQQVQIVGYYDQLHDIRYDQVRKFINFTMPFDWSEDNLRQVTVVHQEIRIPRTLGDFVVTKYDAYVNNIKLPERLVSIDDYSLDSYRVVHLILLRQDVQLLDSAQNQSLQMDFALRPSNETAFPIVYFTRNAQYEIGLSWNPSKIVEGLPTEFDFKVTDPYRPNSTLAPIPYTFSVLNSTNGIIYHKNGETSGLGKVDVLFPQNYTGPITVSFDNLDDNTFANAQFSTNVLSTSTVPEFSLAPLILGLVFVLTISLQLIFKTNFKKHFHPKSNI